MKAHSADNPFDDIFGSQNRRHFHGRARALRERWSNISGLGIHSSRPVIREIDIWCAAVLMLKRGSENAPRESAAGDRQMRG
jgi:hypothetical protein